MKAQHILRTAAAISCFLGLVTGHAQVTYDVRNLPASDVYEVTATPGYPGGKTALMDFLAEHLKYPIEALNEGITGSVVVEFTIEADGYVTESKILAGLGYGCDEAVLQLIEEMPRWEPASINGKPVACQYDLPVRFSLRPAL